uniref:Ribosomal protein S16 n=1 Tax=Fragaria vesca subsp. bracteata TaxID=157670 RepID=A0A0H3W2A1_FRAVE|nr:ribosomal protein S16 [Fragaria vesca subsp. bracteata]
MMSSQEHFHSYIIYIKMVDVRLHSGSCPSSRTLLSTTSF